jgi:hypothetical protein
MKSPSPSAVVRCLVIVMAVSCGSAPTRKPTTGSGGNGGDQGTGGTTAGGTGGGYGAGGSSAGGSGGSSTGGSTGGSGGSSTGGSGGSSTGGSSGSSGGADSGTAADAGKADGGGASDGGSSGNHAVTPDNALVQCKTTAKYRLPGASVTDFCNFYEKYCPYADSQPPRDISPPTPATSAFFKSYQDCVDRYTAAPAESKSCRAGQLCGTNYMMKPIGQGCTHATGHFDGPCYAK